MGVWFSCLSHTSVPKAAATWGHRYCGVGGTSGARKRAAASTVAPSGSWGGSWGAARPARDVAASAFMGGKYRTRNSTVTVQLIGQIHPTGPLLYMSLEAKQDHRLPAQLAARFAQRIETHALRPGTRLPSIRDCAIESRRGSGFYVRVRHKAPRRAAAHPMPSTVLDVSWLLRAQRRQSPGSEQPGAGLLPEKWLDHDLVAAAVRGVGRSRGSWLLKYGAVEGYLPLREALATRLAHIGIGAPAEQIITTAGATQAIDLVARRFLAPGDTVFVEDPAWFVMFARFAAFGARVVGVPRTGEGPDIAALESLLAREKPKLF